MADRPGRGRLSSIDQLPSDADDAIRWAAVELLNRKRTQADILFELNDRLEAIGCPALSRSAFNRHATRKTAAARSLNETTAVAAAVAETLTPDKHDNITVLVVQLIKQAAFEILEKGNVGSKSLQELGRALHLGISAQKLSVDYKHTQQANIAKTISTGVDLAAAQRGLTPETVEAIKASILGITLSTAPLDPVEVLEAEQVPDAAEAADATPEADGDE